MVLTDDDDDTMQETSKDSWITETSVQLDGTCGVSDKALEGRFDGMKVKGIYPCSYIHAVI